jgi:hypothetical protein
VNRPYAIDKTLVLVPESIGDLLSKAIRTTWLEGIMSVNSFDRPAFKPGLP